MAGKRSPALFPGGKKKKAHSPHSSKKAIVHVDLDYGEKKRKKKKGSLSSSRSAKGELPLCRGRGRRAAAG